jgi:hypothetical protein
MKREASSHAAFAVKASLLALLSFVGCSTRVVELTPPIDAAGAACSDFQREDGVTCRLCFERDGGVKSATCPATPMAQAKPEPMMTMTNPAAFVCKVIPTSDGRCLECTDASGAMKSACLKCAEPTPSPGGGTCRVCVWSDTPMDRCLRCEGDPKLESDSCDGLRKERLVYGNDGGA